MESRKLVPRDYQIAADNFLWDGIHQNPTKNPLVVMATGLGKSLSMAMTNYRLYVTYPGIRILNLVHVKELVGNNYNTLKRLDPRAPAGVYSAGLGRRELDYPIIFAGIDSIAHRIEEAGFFNFVFVDEAHRIGKAESARYNQVINTLKAKNPNLLVVGFTATDYRMGMGKLTDGGELFDYIAFDLATGENFVWALNNHYLIRPVPIDPGFQVDTDNVKITAGDFNDKAASAAFRDQDILERAVDSMILAAEQQTRLAGLIFCQSIEDADLVADMFSYKGLKVESVHSKRDDRDEVLAAFKRGELWGVTNKDILTTGFDHPNIDLIGMLRMTRSPSLWVQMLGRGTRPAFAPGYDIATFEGRRDAILASHKQTCLVMDFAGNTERLGPINYPRMPRRKGASAGGDPPVRKCPQCRAYHHPSIKVCTECGYVFPEPAKFKAKASTNKLVKDEVIDLRPPPAKEFEVFDVHRMVCSHHTGRNGKPDTMRVDYFSGIRRFSKWVCFAHPVNTFPRKDAEAWWRRHSTEAMAAPREVSEALQYSSTFVRPKFIKVWVNTKYPEIVDYDFRGTKFNIPPEAGGPPLQEPSEDPTAAPPTDPAELKRINDLMQEMIDDDIPF